MTAFVTDTFTATDGSALQSRSGELGAGWSKETTGSGFSEDCAVYSGRVILNSTSHADYSASGTPASAEYDVQADVYTVNGGSNRSRPQVSARWDTAADNRYQLLFDCFAGFSLNKVIAGAATNLGSYSITYGDGESHTMLLQCRDATKKVFIDSVEQISTTDNAITAAGKVGLHFVGAGSSTTGQHLDNFSATDVGAPVAHSGLFQRRAAFGLIGGM